MRTHHYRPNTSRNADIVATFHQQMADFARGERLKALRDERHLSQEDAAHEIGVTTRALRAWEKGGKIKWPNAKAAGAFYEVDPESLVARETSPLPTVAGTDSAQMDRIEAEVRATSVALAGMERRLMEKLEQIARAQSLGTAAKRKKNPPAK